MSAKGILIGGVSYASALLLFMALRGGPRGGDMPMGLEIFVWPVVMLPLGWFGWLVRSFQWKLSTLLNDLFATHHALDGLVMAGNFLLWAAVGGLFFRLFRRGA